MGSLSEEFGPCELCGEEDFLYPFRGEMLCEYCYDTEVQIQEAVGDLSWEEIDEDHEGDYLR